MSIPVNNVVELVGGPLCGKVIAPERVTSDGLFAIRWWFSYPQVSYDVLYQIDPIRCGGTPTASFVSLYES